MQKHIIEQAAAQLSILAAQDLYSSLFTQLCAVQTVQSKCRTYTFTVCVPALHQAAKPCKALP